MPLFRLVQRWTAVFVAIVLLNLSLTFYNIWPTPRIRWQGHISAELAAVIVGLAVWIGCSRGTAPGDGIGVRRRVVGALAAVWVALVIGRYLDVMAPALYGRPINLYWDARHLSAVASMFTDSIPAGVLAGALAAVVAGLGVAYLAARLAWAAVGASLAHAWDRRILGTVAALLLAVWGVGWVSGFTPPHPQFSPMVSQAYWRHARVLGTQLASHSAAVVTSRAATQSDLQHVRGADVYLVFVESYGAVSYDRRDVVERLAPQRARFDADVRESGRQVVSAFVDSPTFGGSSWLAHVTLMTGVEARDEDTNVLLMSQQRDTLVSTFARQGYRTVALMPGLTKQLARGRVLPLRSRLRHRTAGLRRAALRLVDGARSVRPGAAGPAGARAAAGRAGHALRVFPTTSTHAPFGPTAPYQPDWARVIVGRSLRRAGCEGRAGADAELRGPGAQLRKRRVVCLLVDRRLSAASCGPRPGDDHAGRPPAGRRGVGGKRLLGRARARDRQPAGAAGPAARARLPRWHDAAAPRHRPDARAAADTARRVRQPITEP